MESNNYFPIINQADPGQSPYARRPLPYSRSSTSSSQIYSTEGITPRVFSDSPKSSDPSLDVESSPPDSPSRAAPSTSGADGLVGKTSMLKEDANMISFNYHRLDVPNQYGTSSNVRNGHQASLGVNSHHIQTEKMGASSQTQTNTVVSNSASQFPDEFRAPKDVDGPDDIFVDLESAWVGSIYDGSRSVHRDHYDWLLLRTHGGKQKRSDLSMGWAFAWCKDPHLVVSARLESQTETGEPATTQPLRAELRAVLAALEYYQWEDEEWKQIIIGTSSAVVVSTAVHEAKALWIDQSHPSGISPLNRVNADLWRRFFSEVRRLQNLGIRVRMYYIPSKKNLLTYNAARAAAEGIFQAPKPDPCRGFPT